MLSKDLEVSLNAAVSEARERGHEYLCVEHLLYVLTEDRLGCEILEHCGADVALLRQSLNDFFVKEMETVAGPVAHMQQTAEFERLMQRAFLHVQYSGKEEVDAGDILAALFEERDSHAAYFLREQGITRLDVLNYVSHGIHKDVYEEHPNDGAPLETPAEGEEGPDRPKRDPLDVFTISLSQKAAEGRIDPLIGREPELRRTVRILSRRRKNNPIFVGEPGVGKTALAEGLALRIHEGRVSDALKEIEIRTLDMAALLAGTKFRGDFEQRMKAVVNELVKRPDIVLFIDEIHTVIGAGATSDSTMDASTILKPPLASGEIRCIGSSTYDEYKKHFEKDRALSRRFQKVDVEEPTVEETVRILRGLKEHYERHHDMTYTDTALRAAAELSAKHINDRFLPDKAIDVMDEAGANVKLESGGQRKTVRPADIELIVAEIARVPARSVSSSDKEKLGALDTELNHVVFGQDEALGQVTRAIKRSRAGLGRLDKPIGCFLFTGPTGVGKTEVAKQLAAILGNHFARYDMSEYMEKHAVARLIGAPPGYVGFDQGGLLVDEIRKHPYTVLLLDEIEKAHADLFSILLQVMDNAALTDNQGRKADFRNVVLIMTSNAGARDLAAKSIGFKAATDDAERKSLKAVEKAFSPEFRNRLDAVVTFHALPMDVILMVVDKFIAQLQAQLTPRKVSLELTGAARQWLAENGYDERMGARPLGRLIQQQIETPLSDEILFGKLEKGGTVLVDVKEKDLTLEYEAAGAQGRSSDG
ncbi:MAG: ATP-dependent Clp protease ATP-binding subunit ClpA [Candidatus Hydrogenedentota bacterium]